LKSPCESGIQPLSSIKLKFVKVSADEKVGILKTYRNEPWLDQECSELGNKRKQAILFCLQKLNDQTAADFTNI
jgi:hypothetical protein